MKLCRLLLWCASGILALFISIRPLIHAPKEKSNETLAQTRRTTLPKTHFAEVIGVQPPAFPRMRQAHCFDMEFGWIFAADRQQAEEVAEDVRAAARAFYRHFGMVPLRGAVVLLSPGRPSGPAPVRPAGAAWVQMWPDFSATLNGSIPHGPGSFPPHENTATERAQMRTQWQETPFFQYRPLRHALGHLWLLQDLYGQPGASISTSHTRGTAPAWLAESAAILMENETLTTTRRKRFRALAQSNPQMRGIIPLKDFFAMEAPTHGKPAPMRSPSAITISPQVTPIRAGEKQPAFVPERWGDNIAELGVFYNQSRSLVDFLLARSGNPQILREIVKADQEGLSMAHWLARSGAENRLPSSLEEFEKQWLEWVMQETSLAKNPGRERPGWKASG